MKFLVLILMAFFYTFPAQACICFPDETEEARHKVFEGADFIGKVRYFGSRYSINYKNIPNFEMWKHALQNRTVRFFINRSVIFEVVESYKGNPSKYIEAATASPGVCLRPLPQLERGEEVDDAFYYDKGKYLFISRCDYASIEGHLHEAKYFYKGKN